MGNDSKCNFVTCEQGTEEWYNARLGKVTASRFKDVMTNGRGSAASKTAESYMMQLIAESLTQNVVNEFSTPATKWGTDNEPAARSLYEWRTGVPIEEVGFATIADCDKVGASTDGLIGDEMCVEIKCPYNSVNHLRTIETGVPKVYEWQIQGQLWVLDRTFCEFISYDPRMPESYRMVTFEVERDEDMIDMLRDRVGRFVEVMLSRFRQIEDRVHEAMVSSQEQGEI